MQARMDAQAALIVQAAIRVLSRRGLPALTMHSVAEESRMTTNSVYKHFEDESAMVLAVFRNVASREAEAVAAVTKSGNAAQRIRSAVETFALRALRNPKLAFVLLAAPVDAALTAERLRFRRAFTDILVTMITEGIAAGELPRQQARVSASALHGAVAEVVIGQLIEAPDESVVPELVSFALRAVGVTESAASTTELREVRSRIGDPVDPTETTVVIPRVE